jgi:hypothetical protein
MMGTIEKKKREKKTKVDRVITGPRTFCDKNGGHEKFNQGAMHACIPEQLVGC